MSAHERLVVAHSDGSYRRKCAAYGVTAAGWRGPRVDDNGLCPPWLRSSLLAEVFAAVRAAEIAVGSWPTLDHLVIRCDNLVAIEILAGAEPTIGPRTGNQRRDLWGRLRFAVGARSWVIEHCRGRHGAAGTTAPEDAAARADWLARAALGIAHIQTSHRNAGPGAVARGAR